MKIEDMREASPIVIIGAARSGTKFLRDLLVTDPGFSCVPYDVNYIWRIGNEKVEHDELSPSSLTPKNRDEIVRTLFRLASIDTNEVCLVEKSVSNGMRIPFVLSVFPNARFIHLIRDGRAVVESSTRMWNAPPQKSDLFKKLRSLPLNRFGYVFWFAKNYLVGKLSGRSGGAVWGPRYKDIQHDLTQLTLTEVIATQWKKTVDLADSAFQEISSDRVLTVHYESLMEDLSELSRIAEFIGHTDLNSLERVYTERVIADNAQKWRVDMDKDALMLVEKIAGETLKRYKYV